ncbi:27019_t:CDS:2, partial [Racocetra persica]
AYCILINCDPAQIKALCVVFPEKKTRLLECKLVADEKRSLENELFEDLKYLMRIDEI